MRFTDELWWSITPTYDAVLAHPFLTGLADGTLPLARRGSSDPRYQQWIATYGGAEFGDVVQEVLDVTDRLGAGLAPTERARAAGHFRATSRYEWMFWDMGHRQERWPDQLSW